MLRPCVVCSYCLRHGNCPSILLPLQERTQAEAGLEWLGLILFRNELKPDSAAAMEEIKGGDVRPEVVVLPHGASRVLVGEV